MSTIYEIGKFYDVPVAILNDVTYKSAAFGYHRIIPIIGDKHDDLEIIGINEIHYHVDWRFVGLSLYESNSREYYGSIGVELGTVLSVGDVKEMSTRRLKCKRDFSPYPKFPKFIPKLQEKYKGAVAKKGRCPHKGVDLTTIRPDSDGCVTCPLHGLKWNASTWELATNSQ